MKLRLPSKRHFYNFQACFSPKSLCFLCSPSLKEFKNPKFVFLWASWRFLCHFWSIPWSESLKMSCWPADMISTVLTMNKVYSCDPRTINLFDEAARKCQHLVFLLLLCCLEAWRAGCGMNTTSSSSSQKDEIWIFEFVETWRTQKTQGFWAETCLKIAFYSLNVFHTTTSAIYNFAVFPSSLRELGLLYLEMSNLPAERIRGP